LKIGIIFDFFKKGFELFFCHGCLALTEDLAMASSNASSTQGPIPFVLPGGAFDFIACV